MDRRLDVQVENKIDKKKKQDEKKKMNRSVER